MSVEMGFQAQGNGAGGENVCSASRLRARKGLTRDCREGGWGMPFSFQADVAQYTARQRLLGSVAQYTASLIGGQPAST